jgi:hypothetical protein
MDDSIDLAGQIVDTGEVQAWDDLGDGDFMIYGPKLKVAIGQFPAGHQCPVEHSVNFLFSRSTITITDADGLELVSAKLKLTVE